MKIRFLAAVLFLILPALAGGGASTLSTAPTILLPAPGIRSVIPWQANHAYTNGQYITLWNSTVMCLTTGTSGTNQPALVGTTDISDNTVVWRPALPFFRHGLAISVNDGVSTVRIDFSNLAATNTGVRLVGGVMLLDSTTSVPQSQVSGCTEVSTTSVSVTEW